MNQLNRILIVLWAVLASVNLFAQEMTAREIMVKVDERDDGDDSRSETEMILINKNGKQRIRKILSYSKDYGKDSKSIMVFQQPADVKGTGFLSWEYDDESKDDDRWLYMPALRKVRRISGDSNNDYFMGSDFTYDDMGDRNVDEDTHELLKEETFEGCDCWVIKSIPKDDDDNYEYKISRVRKDIWMVINVEYYNKMGLMKKLEVKDIQQIDGIWTAHQFVMENFEKKHKTIINFQNFQYNTGIDDNVFTVATIERGRLK